jgi:UDP-N-acetylmuramate dehydrogenase
MEEKDKIFHDKLRTNVRLAPLTTFKIGGPARFYIEPTNQADFTRAILWARKNSVPFLILGGGSNVLIHDSGFNGLVIYTGALNRIEVHENKITAECGASVDSLVDKSLEQGLTGVEFAAGMPGSIGGAVFMNARAVDRSFSGIIDKVLALKVSRDTVDSAWLKNNDLNFSYKSSVFQKKKFIVYKVVFKLTKGSVHSIESNIRDNKALRKSKGQYLFPNAGCIFKNSRGIGMPTGKFIEELGLKGKRIGDAEIFEEHANFIINRGKASADDVFRLIKYIENKAQKIKAIKLEREINLVGDW